MRALIRTESYLDNHRNFIYDARVVNMLLWKKLPSRAYERGCPLGGKQCKSYDLNGALLSNNRMDCRWNEDQRMDRIQDHALNTRSEMVYDGMGRRTRRTDYDAKEAGTQVAERGYFYDGWNHTITFERSNGSRQMSKRLTWGLDLSLSQEGAGGVGGLLASDEGEAPYYFFYDGNGNVTGLVNSQGSLEASYQYDVFGELVSSSGNYSAENEYRFSTKPQNLHSGGMYYYGYRYYDPVTGRWLNRDPIQELGGYNLYQMVSNDPVNLIDFLGLSRYEYDSKGFHVHTGYFKKLTYGLKFNDDGSIETIPVRGHEKEFDRNKARRHLKKALCDKDERNKMKTAFAEAWDKFDAKDSVSRKGRTLRRFRSSGGAILGITIGALMIDPADGATRDLIDTLKIIQKDLERGKKIDNLDIGVATDLMQQIGGKFAALLLLDELKNLKPCCP